VALFNSVSFPSQLTCTRTNRSPGFAARATIGDVSSGLASEAQPPGAILIVDDNEMNRDMLCRRLERQGHTVTEVENGIQALEALRARKFDLVLLDVVMPEMGGYETLQQIMADNSLRRIPVIMLSALDDLENVIRCVEIGADDYVTKPFNPVLLNARIRASLEKKQLWDQERNYIDLIEIERQKAETLLRNILPESIANRLKQGENPIADQFPAASVLVADIDDFNQAASHLSPTATVELLNDIVSQFDWLAELHGLEKIKTVADKYIAVSGAPLPQPTHASAVAEMALEMQKVIKRIGGVNRIHLQLRIGLCSGPVVGGVIGRKKFIYDIWGDTVKLAGLLEEHCAPGAILAALSTYDSLRDKYQFKEADALEVKRKGDVRTFHLLGRSSRGSLPAVH
jgi:class 3 adenylate cyclase/CheY-like chemotaxis protein